MADAQIIDRGYRRYDGERTGVRGAVRSVTIAAIQRSLGMRRSIWAKVLPVIAILFAYVPAIVFIGLAALLPESLVGGEFFVGYPDYYGFISAAILLFVAFVAPEVLCTDRQSRMLGLYLASPLTRDTYLLGKLMAIAIVLAVVTVGPPLLLLIAYSIEGIGPDGALGWLGMFARVVAAGVAVSATYTAISLAISSFTDRRAIASAAIIGTLLVLGTAVGSLVTAGGSDWLYLADPNTLPFEFVNRIYGERGEYPTIPTWAIAAAEFVWAFGAAALIRARYARLVIKT